MALSPRKVEDEVLHALVAAHNSTRTAAATVASFFHADATSGVTSGLDGFSPTASALTATSANGSDLPTSIALANELRAKLLVHMADTLAHKVADTTNSATLVAVPVAVDLTTLEALLNQEKASFNAHLTQAGVHYNNDGTNTVAAANASDLGTSETLVNAIKTSYNAHIISAPAGSSINVLPA